MKTLIKLTFLLNTSNEKVKFLNAIKVMKKQIVDIRYKEIKGNKK